MDLILLTIFWVVWNERSKRAFSGVDNVDDFDLLKNKWVQILSFLLLSYHLYSMKDLRNLIDTFIDL